MSTGEAGGNLSGEDAEMASALSEGRPAPPADFLSALGVSLARDDPGWPPRPVSLWLPALAAITTGIILLLVAALIATGRI